MNSIDIIRLENKMDSLSNELIFYILGYLNDRDIINFTATCRRFNKFKYNITFVNWYPASVLKNRLFTFINVYDILYYSEGLKNLPMNISKLTTYFIPHKLPEQVKDLTIVKTLNTKDRLPVYNNLIHLSVKAPCICPISFSQFLTYLDLSMMTFDHEHRNIFLPAFKNLPSTLKYLILSSSFDQKCQYTSDEDEISIPEDITSKLFDFPDTIETLKIPNPWTVWPPQLPFMLKHLMIGCIIGKIGYCPYNLEILELSSLHWNYFLMAPILPKQIKKVIIPYSTEPVYDDIADKLSKYNPRVEIFL